jgi:hypothetical protein
MCKQISTALAFLTIVVAANVACGHQAENLRVIYFGNSFLGNSVPWFHPTLARSAGHEMHVQAHLGPGWQIWMHVNTFHTNPERSRKSLAEGDWDAVVIQHFGAHPLLKDNVRKGVFHNQEPFPEPRDVSDMASASVIIDTFLSGHPDRGRALIYNSWPGIPAAGEFRRRVREETKKSLQALGLPREEVLQKVKERKPTLEEMIPLMRKYDYESEWLAEYERNDEVPFKSKHFHSRDYVWKLMHELKAKYPALWKEGRLALIPNGDVFLALDKRLRDGEMPGVENIGFFSRDGGHVRAGLPRYTLAATCFAVMYREHPKALDWSIYNDLDNYANENIKKIGMGGYVHQPDLGVLLEITPERARIVNDTVWEVVKNHPYTAVTKE